MDISLSDLQIICSKIIDHLKAEGLITIHVPYDFYWNIPQKEIYNPYQEPTGFTQGQLSDDWRELTKIAQGEGAPLAYTLVWLAAILRVIGEEIVS